MQLPLLSLLSKREESKTPPLTALGQVGQLVRGLAQPGALGASRRRARRERVLAQGGDRLSDFGDLVVFFGGGVRICLAFCFPPVVNQRLAFEKPLAKLSRALSRRRSAQRRRRRGSDEVGNAARKVVPSLAFFFFKAASSSSKAPSVFKREKKRGRKKKRASKRQALRAHSRPRF